MTEDDPKVIARKRRAALVAELKLSATYKRAHSPSGVYRRRIFWNPETSQFELSPEAKRVDKQKADPSDPRLANLRNQSKRK